MKEQEVLDICVKEFLVPNEGYAKKLPNGDCLAYPDPATGGDPFTIGYGSTFDEFGVRVKPGEIWTHEKALRVKAIVLKQFLNILIRMSPGLASEPSRRVAAILSWVYNIGYPRYRTTTFKKKIDEKDWLAAQVECNKWNKANGKIMKGLTKRRIQEGLAIAYP